MQEPDLGKHLLHFVTVQKSMSHLFTEGPIHYYSCYYYYYYYVLITDKMLVLDKATKTTIQISSGHNLS